MHAKLTGRWRGLAAVPMDNGTRTQYPQTTATPGPSKFRMQFPHDTNRCTLKNRKISTIRFQYLKYAQGNCMRNSEMQSGLSTMPRPAHRHGGCRKIRRAWLRCPWAVAGPGCGTRGRRQGLAAAPVGGGRAWLRHPWTAAGPGRTTSRRAERSSRRGRLAGGPPPTGASARPTRQATRRPEHQQRHNSKQEARRPQVHQPGPRDRPRGARNTRGATSRPSSAGI